MEVKIYANYGVLAHEKQTIYSCSCPHHQADYSEKVTVKIPDELNPYIDKNGFVCIRPDNSYIFVFNEGILYSVNDKPVIRYSDMNGKGHTVTLTVIEGR